MRLLTLTATYQPSLNGVAVTTALHKQVMEKLGHQFFVIAPSHPNHWPESDVFRLPSLPNPFSSDYPLILPFPTPSVVRLLISQKFDCLIFHHPYVIGQSALLLAKLFKIPAVFFYHTHYDLYIDHYLPKILPSSLHHLAKWLLLRPVVRAMNKSNLVVVETPTLGRQLSQTYPSAKIAVIPSGRQTMALPKTSKARLPRKYHLPPTKIILLCTARLTIEKNLDTLLRIFSQIQLPNIHLCLAGDGPQLSSLTYLAKSLRITSRVTFLGAIPFSQMPEVYSLADIYVYTSLTETQGATVLEAMSAGLPVVALTAPGPQDFIQPEITGFLAASEAEFSKLLHRLVSDSRLRHQMGQAGKLAAAKLDLPSWGQAWEKVLTTPGT